MFIAVRVHHLSVRKDVLNDIKQSVFGMNVNWFQNNPTVKWYFIAAAVQLIIVLVAYLAAKHYMQRKRRRRQLSQRDHILEYV
jgi:p-aminobenzoyl-glutamate transporter AbgT